MLKSRWWLPTCWHWVQAWLCRTEYASKAPRTYFWIGAATTWPVLVVGSISLVNRSYTALQETACSCHNHAHQSNHSHVLDCWFQSTIAKTPVSVAEVKTKDPVFLRHVQERRTIRPRTNWWNNESLHAEKAPDAAVLRQNDLALRVLDLLGWRNLRSPRPKTLLPYTLSDDIPHFIHTHHIHIYI